MKDITNTPVTVNGKRYIGGDLPEQGQHVLRHLVDIDEQERALRFKLEQLMVTRGAYDAALSTLLNEGTPE